MQSIHFGLKNNITAVSDAEHRRMLSRIVAPIADTFSDEFVINWKPVTHPKGVYNEFTADMTYRNEPIGQVQALQGMGLNTKQHLLGQIFLNIYQALEKQMYGAAAPAAPEDVRPQGPHWPSRF